MIPKSIYTYFVLRFTGDFMADSKVTRDEYIGFRVSALVKEKIEKFAEERGFSVGELVTLGTLTYMQDHKEVAGILSKRVLKKPVIKPK